MSFFYGEQARGHEVAVKTIFKEFLTSALNAPPYQAQFAPYGGVEIVYSDTEAQEAEKQAKPYLDIHKSGVITERWGKKIAGVYYPGLRYSWTFEAVAIASDFSGAVTGAANPISSDTLLSDALHFIVSSDAGYQALASQGLEEVSIEADNETSRDRVNFNPYRISFTTHALSTYTPL